MVAETQTLIIGAGPAGLAVGAVLRRCRAAFDIIERGTGIAPSWRRHYERLHLHTPKKHSALPFVAFPRSYPRYPSRDQVIEYLDGYARAFDLRPHFGVDVQRCARVDGRWEVQTAAGNWRARNLVVATGFNRVPRRPAWPGLGTFPGPVVHSSDYTNGERFRGQRVLVVGFGNSGAEIALDLLEHGAAVAIAVRGRVNVIPRDLLGIPVIALALAGRRIPPGVSDRINALWIRLAIGNLARYGLRPRAEGPAVEILTHRHVPVLDIGTLAQIRAGRIALRPAPASFAGESVCFADGTREVHDAVVLATGFATGLAALLPQAAAVLDADGCPHVYGCEAAPGLFFCGFHLVPTGFLREIALEAARIGAQIAAQRALHAPA